MPKLTEQSLPQNQGGGKQAKPTLGALKQALAYIKDMLGQEGRVTRLNKTEQGFEIEVEVVEPSEHMKKIGIPKPVYDKNVYQLILDHNLELISYERQQKPYSKDAL